MARPDAQVDWRYTLPALVFLNPAMEAMKTMKEVLMRRAFGALLVVGALVAVPALVQGQAEQTWKGTISDGNCNAKHPAGEHDGKKMTDADCTNVCVKKGAKYVFVSEGKVFQLANQSSKQIAAHAGQQVELTGTAKGDTITAKQLKAAK
jgi:hypothetical protein